MLELSIVKFLSVWFSYKCACGYKMVCFTRKSSLSCIFRTISSKNRHHFPKKKPFISIPFINILVFCNVNSKIVASIAVSTQSAEWWHWARSLWSVRFHFELHYLSDHSLLQNHVCPLSLTQPLIPGCPFNCCCWYDLLHTAAVF